MINKLKATDRQAGLRRIRAVSHLLDNAIVIPVIGYRIGLDPLLGLFPAVGDMIGLVLSVYIVVEASRFGLSKETLLRMVGNLLTDAGLGSLPGLGDIFDVVWKANSRNLALLEDHLRDPAPHQAADRRFVIVILVATIGLLIGIVLLFSWLIAGAIRLLFGG